MKLATLMILISSLIFLTACGGQQTSKTSLVVSSSMFLSNSSFSGGLVVQGIGPNGQEFSEFIPATAGATSNQLMISLPQGIWTFRAIGWESLANTNFNGTSKCSEVANVDLSQSEQTVILEATTGECSRFGNITAGTFHDLKLITCGQYYKAGGSKVSVVSDWAYCDPSQPIPVNVKKWAKSAKISYLGKRLESDWVPTQSVCIPSDTYGRLIGSPGINLPTKNFPFLITLFEDINCDNVNNKIMVEYPFFKGIDHNYLAEPRPKDRQEQILIGDGGGSNNYLYLSTSDIRRGTSSFMSLTPSFKCSGQSCVPVFSAPSSVKPPVVGTYGSFLLGKESPTIDCALGVTVTSPPAWYSGIKCIEESSEDEKSDIIVEFDFDQAYCSSNPCDLTFNMGSNPHDVTLKGANSNFSNILRNLYRSLGHYYTNTTSLSLSHFTRTITPLTQAELYSGGLSKVVEMFQADGPAGLLGEGITCDENMDLTKLVTLKDDGEDKTYQVEIKGANKLTVPHPIPKFICNDTNTNPGSCFPQFYQAFMTVRRQVGPSWVTEYLMKFRCDKKLGELETQHEYKHDGVLMEEKEYFYWNTHNDSYARFEVYSINKSISPENAIARTGFLRAEKFAPTNFRLTRSHLERWYTGGLYHQKIQRQDSTVEGNDFGTIELKFESFDSNADDFFTTLGTTTILDGATPVQINEVQQLSSSINGSYTDLNCIGTSPTVPLTVDHDTLSCPSSGFTDVSVLPVKALYQFKLKELNPTTFNNAFTGSLLFKYK